MERFCRIIELPETQVLLMVDYDSENDAYTMGATVVIGGIYATLKMGFEKEEDAIEAMDSYTEENAMMIVKAVKEDFVSQ